MYKLLLEFIGFHGIAFKEKVTIKFDDISR